MLLVPPSVKSPLSLVVVSVVLAAGVSVQTLVNASERVSNQIGLLDRLVQLSRRPIAYEAIRRLEASSAKLNESAWLEAFTAYDDAGGFRYQVLGEGGSSRIRNRVLLSVLEAERQSSERDEWQKTTLNRENYDFNLDGTTADGLIKVQLNPRRRDVRLVNGAAWLSAESGGLVRLQGRLSKSPSFWVRWVDVTRRYQQFRGAIMPVALESIADVRFAGVSTFSMQYDYAMVNGERLAPPVQPVLAVGLLSNPRSKP
jgi:hypothetical protein